MDRQQFDKELATILDAGPIRSSARIFADGSADSLELAEVSSLVLEHFQWDLFEVDAESLAPLTIDQIWDAARDPDRRPYAHPRSTTAFRRTPAGRPHDTWAGILFVASPAYTGAHGRRVDCEKNKVTAVDVKLDDGTSQAATLSRNVFSAEPSGAAPPTQSSDPDCRAPQTAFREDLVWDGRPAGHQATAPPTVRLAQ